MLCLSCALALRDSCSLSRASRDSNFSCKALFEIRWCSINFLRQVFPADWSATGSGSSLLVCGSGILGGSVGAVAGIKVDFCATAGATASASGIVRGDIFVVVAVPIAWNATNAL